jgi:SulP family sulfate permease
MVVDQSPASKIWPIVRGDIAGGIASAIVTLPQVIGYGLIAFAPLGAEFAGNAAALGIYAAVFAGFVASLLGSSPIQITGPKVPLTLLVAAMVMEIVSWPEVAAATNEVRVLFVLGSVSICVMIGGLFQVLLGASGIGAFTKYVPYPVIGGFMNGVAVLLIIGQIPPLLGVVSGASAYEIFIDPTGIQLPALVVGSATVAGILLGRRLIPQIPASLTGVLAGMGMHYGLEIFGGVTHAGPLLASTEFQLPVMIEAPDIWQTMVALELREVLPQIVITGLAIGLIGALESLFSCVIADNLTEQRSDTNRELVAQGLGNLANGLAATLPAAGSIPRTRVNYQAGGRKRTSGILCATFTFLFFLALGPVLDNIPRATIAGMLLVVGIELVDGWTVSLARKIKAQTDHRRTVLLELSVAFVVALITISVNLVVAVGVGIAAASALFIARMGKAVVRRRYDGRAVRSRKMRSLQDERQLNALGDRVSVFELEGPIFFGSGDSLFEEIGNGPTAIRYLILDMRKVNDIDSTGTRMLRQLKTWLDRQNKMLLVSNLPRQAPLWQFLDIMGVVGAFGPERFFDTTDEALEWAEEILLAGADHEPDRPFLKLGDTPIADGMTTIEIEQLAACMTELRYQAGELIFAEGDSKTEMLVVLCGSVTIRQQTGAGEKSKRVFTYGPGSLIGELALLDQRPRSASAWADMDTLLICLDPEIFASLKEQSPQLALKLIENIARVVSGKLRRTSAELAALENK